MMVSTEYVLMTIPRFKHDLPVKLHLKRMTLHSAVLRAYVTDKTVQSVRPAQQVCVGPPLVTLIL